MTNTVESGSIKEKIGSRCFSLPMYQRSYSWNKKQIDDFTDDLSYSINTDSEHYLDSIIVYNPDNENELINKIVDGQQRITSLMLLFSAVVDRVNVEKENIDDDIFDKKSDVVRQKCHNMINDVDGQSGLTYVPDDKQKDIYVDLIKSDKEDPTLSECETPAEKNLVKNKKRLSNWVKNVFEDRYDKASDIEDYASKIEYIVDKIRQNLTITIYEVKDKLEANRMFEVVNDRGKKVNVADKVKSYLSYYTSINGDTQKIREIDKVFHELQLEIARDEDVSNVSVKINAFIDEHWRVFSGITNSTGVNVHSEIKDVLGRESDYDRGKAFIDSYLKSLKENMRYYKYVQDDVKYVLDEEEIEGIRDNRSALYVANKFGADSLMIFVTSMLSSYRTGDEGLRRKLRREFEVVERLIINHYNLSERRADFNRTNLRESAIMLEWSRRKASAEYVFNDEDYSEDMFCYDESWVACIKGIKKLTDKMDSTVVENHLRDLDDCLNGDTRSGIDKDIIKYILFWYELDSFTSYYPNKNPLEDFEDGKSEYFTLEHILPKNLDDNYEFEDYNISGEDEHQRLNNNLGNLAILSINENRTATNNPYSKKCSKVYNNQDITRMIKKGVVEEYDVWDESSIEERKEILIDYITNKWK